ncbi:hypothetical protein [Streptococcus parauberis]|uniref:hypothetical protein n=1 Tax=Streptococcus parauberis TaxID=1348 RepID=UPI001401EACC|nr:hypothetical protein [Streptococcus parauberis]
MVKNGSHFQRYSYDFKVKVVEDYLSRNSGELQNSKYIWLESTYQVMMGLKNINPV